MIIHGASTNPVHLHEHSPNCDLGLLDTLPPDALRGIVGALNFGSLTDFMKTSKKLRQRLEEPDMGPSLARHVPTIYRTQSRLFAMIEGVWRSIWSAAVGYPMTPEYLIPPNKSRKEQFQLYRVLSGRLGKWSRALRVCDPTPGTNRMRRAVIIDCIAIEILLTDYRSRVLAKPEVIGIHDGEVGECKGIAVSLIEQLLQLKEYFSPRLFRLLLRRDGLHLLHAFFSQLDEGDRKGDREKNKELARFLLKNCDRFLLCIEGDNRARLRDLLGAEFEELSSHMVFAPGRSTLETLPSDAFGEIVGRLDLDVLINVMVASKWLRRRLNGPDVRPSLVRHLPTIYRTQPGIVERLVEVIEGVWQSMGNMVLGYQVQPYFTASSGKLKLTRLVSDIEIPPQELNPMYEIQHHPVEDPWDGPVNFPLNWGLWKRLDAWRETLESSHSIPSANNGTEHMLVPSIKGCRSTTLDRQLLGMAIDCIAIEKLLMEHEPLLRAKPKIKKSIILGDGGTVKLISTLIDFRDHFSPKLFSFLLSRDRDELWEALRSLLDTYGYREKNEELVRFLLKNCDGFLLGLKEDQRARIENLLGTEVEALSMHHGSVQE